MGGSGGSFGNWNHLTHDTLNFFQEKAEAEAASAQQAQQAESANETQITNESQQLNDLYGVGTDASALSNAKTLGEEESNYTNAQEEASNTELDQQYQSANQSNEEQLGSQGLGGSSVQSDLARSNLSNYISGRQQAVSQATAQTNSLQNTLNSQREQQLGQIQSGTAADPNFGQQAVDVQNQIAGQQAAIVPAAVGSTLTTLGKAAGAALGSSTAANPNPGASAAASGASLPQGSGSTTGSYSG